MKIGEWKSGFYPIINGKDIKLYSVDNGLYSYYSLNRLSHDFNFQTFINDSKTHRVYFTCG